MKIKLLMIFSLYAMTFPVYLSADTHLIKDLEIYDVALYNYNASHWLEQGNLREGALMYGEMGDITITSVPEKYQGADWIQTSFCSKTFRRGNIASFVLEQDAEVAVAHSDRIEQKPEWLKKYSRTKQVIENSVKEHFTLYIRTFKRGEKIVLGENGDITAPMYTVAIKALAKTAATKPAGNLFDIRDYGALDDNKTVNTQAIQQAIDACNAAGGGIVYVNGDIYVTGAIRLKDRVTLWVEAGTILRGSASKKDYAPFRCALKSYRRKEDFQLIYAENARNISITGGGVIDGYSLFDGWPWKGRGNEWERPRLIRMVTCENVNIERISLIRSANWTQYYEGCRGLTLSDVTVRCYTGTANQDGLDISGCRDVRVKDFNVLCGDDAVCLKSMSMLPGDNIVVDGVTCHYVQCNLVKIGTETHGTLRNVTVRNVVGNTHYSLAVESVDGAVIENILYENIILKSCSSPFVIRLGNRGRVFDGSPEVAPVGAIRNVTFRNIKVEQGGFEDFRGGVGVGAPIAGLPGHPIRNVTIEDCDLRAFGSINDKSYVYREIPERDEAYPEFHVFGVLPSWGIWFRHVDGVKIRNVSFSLEHHDIRPVVMMDDVKNYSIENITYDRFLKSELSPFWDVQNGEITVKE